MPPQTGSIDSTNRCCVQRWPNQ